MRLRITVRVISYAILALMIIVPLSVEGIWHHISVDHVTATVTRVERVGDGYGDSSRYLIWADVQDEQGTSPEVFENVDAWYFFKWNSSDVYGQLEIGQTYDLKVSGARWRFASWYRNIVAIE